MKAYRDSYGQTYESLSTLGERYKRLPAGWKFRVAELDRDLVLCADQGRGDRNGHAGRVREHLRLPRRWHGELPAVTRIQEGDTDR